jgi:TRAP-type C4-dicarboxylate transport system permease small subunit
VTSDGNGTTARTRLPSSLERAWNTLLLVEAWVTGAALAAIVVVSLLNVFMRYVLASSIVWADEVARLAFIVVSFIAAGLAVAYNAHLVIDSVALKMAQHRVWGKLWQGLIMAVSVGFFLMLIIGGAAQARRGFGQTSPALQIPLGWVYLAMPIGAALMLVNYIGVLLFGPRSLPAEAGEQPVPEAVRGGVEPV